MNSVTISSKGSIVIPKKIRETRGLYPGMRVHIVTYAGVTAIVPVPDDPLVALEGMFADDGPFWTVLLLEEHRKDYEREESRTHQWQEASVPEKESEA